MPGGLRFPRGTRRHVVRGLGTEQRSEHLDLSEAYGELGLDGMRVIKRYVQLGECHDVAPIS